jgi:uncharacterized protein (DUF1499 family)
MNYIILILMSYIFPFQGSQSTDFTRTLEIPHPFRPCPDTPNCVIHSVQFDVDEQTLFDTASTVIKNSTVHKTTVDAESLQINAVYRIPLFGFKDNVEISIESNAAGSILHIRSASRVGHSDLGVNRRRVQRILNSIESKL